MNAEEWREGKTCLVSGVRIGRGAQWQASSNASIGQIELCVYACQ